MPFVLLLFFLSFPAFPAQLEFCPEGRQPSFTFRELYVDNLDPGKRRSELWLDPAEDALRGYWKRKDKPAAVLLGNSMDKGRFFVCEYAWGAKKATAMHFGEKHGDQLVLNGAKLSHPSYLNTARPYILKYDLRTSVHDDPNAADGTRCHALHAFFQVVGPKLTPGQIALNKLVLEKLDEGGAISLDNESRECLARTTVPRDYTAAANVLFSGARYVSLKIDRVFNSKDSKDFNTMIINYDLQTQRTVYRDELIDRKERDKLAKFVRNRIKELDKRWTLEDLESAEFGFTADTLIVSLHPLIPLEIPIPLDTIERVLKITLKAPLRP